MAGECFCGMGVGAVEQPDSAADTCAAHGITGAIGRDCQGGSEAQRKVPFAEKLTGTCVPKTNPGLIPGNRGHAPAIL